MYRVVTNVSLFGLLELSEAMELTRPAAGNAVAVTMAEAVVFKNWRRFKGEQSHPHKKEGCFITGD